MKYFKKHIKIISLLITIFLIILSLTAIYMNDIYAADPQTTATVGATGVPASRIVFAYQFKETVPRTIKWYPIDHDVFYVSASFFPKRDLSGGEYFHGSHGSNTQTSRDIKHGLNLNYLIDGNYHTGYLATFHNRWNGFGDRVDIPVKSKQMHESGYYSSKNSNDAFVGTDNATIMYITPDLGFIYEPYLLKLAGKRSYRDQSPRAAGFDQSPKTTVYTNWAYTGPSIMNIDCEDKKGSGHSAQTGGVAFAIACLKSSDGHRASRPVGNVMSNDSLYNYLMAWYGIGSYGTEGYLVGDLATKYLRYHKRSETPNVNVFSDPTNDSGTTTPTGARYTDASESKISVGPFKMSEYVKATAGIGDTYNNTISDGQYNFINPQSNGADIQAIMGSDHYAGLVKMEAVLKNEAGDKKTVTVFNGAGNNPEPNATFNVTLNSSDVEGYDELYDLKATYQRVHACASIANYDGSQIAVTFERDASSEDILSNETYKCDTCDNNKVPEESRSDIGGKHTWMCNSTPYCGDCKGPCKGHRGKQKCNGHHSCNLTCRLKCSIKEHTHGDCNKDGECTKTEHTHTSSCYNAHCSRYHSFDDWDYPYEDCCYYTVTYPEYCKHGHYKGDHSNSHISGGSFACNGIHKDQCTHETRCNTHNHLTCSKFLWDLEFSSADVATDAISVEGELVNERIEYTVNVQIPLMTEMNFYKYITKITNTVENKVTYSGTERKEMTPEQKKENPLKAEVGDTIEYTLELENKDRFPTKFKIKDVLPEDCEFISVVSDTTIQIGNTTQNAADFVEIVNPTGNNAQTAASWLECPGKSTVRVVLEVRPLNSAALFKLYENNAKYTTANHIGGDINDFMQSGGWGDGNTTNGPSMGGDIINKSNRQEDSEYHYVKGYKVELNKYIYDVEHNKDPQITSSTLDTTYLNSEARRELTDETKKASPVYVEYGDIVTYKIIIDNTLENRTTNPYFEPDKVYVDLEDTLPNKFSNLEVYSDSVIVPHELDGNILKISDFEIPAGTRKVIEVSLIVEEHVKTTIEENRMRITEIRNINNGDEDRFCVVFSEPNKGDQDTLEFNYPIETLTDRTDYYIINDYNVTIDNYLYKYDEAEQIKNNENTFTQEPSIANGTILNQSREGKTEDSKKNYPLSAEKHEKITYAIRVRNEAVNQGDKPATQMRPKVYSAIEQGLEFINVTAKLFDASGNEIQDSTVTANTSGDWAGPGDGRTYAIYEFAIGRETIVDPGQYVEIYVEVEIKKTNMYLYDLRNSSILGILENVNIGNETDPDADTPRVVRNNDYDENIAEDANKESSDYVRMRDLVIAGKVWLDLNRDGKMNNENPTSEDTKYFNVHGTNAFKQGVLVKLYANGSTEPLRTTRTDENGLYTFGREENLTWHADHYTYQDAGTTLTGNYNPLLKYQRIDKADGKDANGNYTPASKPISYIIEYEYDGVIYKSTIYAGRSNISADGTYNDDYVIDSNAMEPSKTREDFNLKYEYISYNAAYNSTLTESANLEFDKTGNTSQLLENEERAMIARSFVTANGMLVTDVDELWLYNGDNTETDYLKYINLGLMLREDVDITLSKDVYKIKTTINGEEMEYEFNKLDETTSGNVKPGMNGMGGLANDYLSNQNYDFELYESDYKYRVDQYIADAVKAYKGQESELNIEITYKIRVYNRETIDDERLANTTDTKLNVKIHEIMDLYDKNFMQYKDNPDESITAKVKTADGYLIDEKIKIAEAWLEDENGVKTQLRLNTRSQGFSAREADASFKNQVENAGYNILYITGTEGAPTTEIVELAEGEYKDIYVKYVLDKENTDIKNPNTNATQTIERGLKIAERAVNKENGLGIEGIGQVNAYSVWYTDGKPVSIVDMDSNAGNIGIQDGNTLGSIEDPIYYEDTTYKTGVNVTAVNTENEPANAHTNPLPGEPNESVMREFRGMVWDDSRTETIGSGNELQYTGDGLYDESKTKVVDAQSNKAVEEIYGASEEKDIKIRNVKAEYIEIVEIPQVDLTTFNRNSTVEENAERRFYEQKLENVTWKYTQNTRSNENGLYLLNGYIPGKYVIRYTYGDVVEEPYNSTRQPQKDMLVFNGQDYKSTKYNQNLTNAANIDDENAKMDAIIAELENGNSSDAKDDEVQRLRVNSYSEVMISEKAEVLKGLSNGAPGILEYTDSNTDEQLKELNEKTQMNAETIEFLVRPEKIEVPGTTYTTLKELTLENVGNSYSARTFSLENVDFGIVYRPEAGMTLEKTIEKIEIITEDTEVIAELYFYTAFDENGKIKHYIDKDKSKGDEFTQFISNTYKNLENGLSTEEIQGFAYIQVDPDILQGATIKITYKLIATNESEIDRISPNLNVLRYKENDSSKIEIDTYKDRTLVNINNQHAAADNGDRLGILDKDYTASGVASNILIAKYYNRDAGGDVYRIIEKDSNEYTGKYLGNVYYTNEIGTDIVAEIKFDKILDYVDTDLVYIEDAASKEIKNREWDTVSSDDLRKYVLKLRKTDHAGNLLHDKLVNPEGIEYKSLVVSVSDRIKDSQSDNELINNEISKFLKPKQVNENEAKGTIYLEVSKVIASETDTKNMVYENIAEIIQYTTLTGRRTNYITTIGDTDTDDIPPTVQTVSGSEEFKTASLQTDSSATEVITLTPPTGLMKNRKVIVNTVSKAIKTARIGIILTTIFISILVIFFLFTHLALRRYSKKRIK